MARSLYLIDGHAQIYRAYYARMDNLTAPSGEPTRATHVFFQMLLNLIRDKRPDYLAVVLDVSDETVFRRDIYPEYKANREPPPEDFPVQKDRILSMLETAAIPMLSLPGFEADDILATLARRYASEAFDTFMVSKDKDLEQLITDRVLLFDPTKDQVIDADTLLESKGWRPEQAVDVQTLCGDNVDNIPGVKGIGPKTAAKLIAKYGSAKAVIEHADELTPKQRENVLAFAPHYEMTRQLVTLRDDVPIELDLEAARCERFQWASLAPVMRELGFRRMPGQLPGVGEGRKAGRPEGKEGEPGAGQDVAAGAPAARGMPGDASSSVSPPPRAALRDGAPAPEVGAAPRGGRTPEVAPDLFSPTPLASPRDGAPEQEDDPIGTPTAREGPVVSPAAAALREPDPGQYELINTPDALAKLVADLAAQPAFAVDTETTGTDPMDATLVGISLAWQVGRGYYIPTRCVHGGELPVELVREKLAPVLADPAKTKIGQNIKYDMLILRQAGMPIAGPLFDTMIAAFVLDPMHASFAMDRIVDRTFGHVMIPITELLGKRGRDQMQMDQVMLAHIAEYAGEDADYTFRLRELYEPQLRGSTFEKLFYEIEMPLAAVLADMEWAGISLDTDLLKKMNGELSARMESLTVEAHALVGHPFNLDSPKQLAEILFDEMGMRVVRKTKTSRSTDADTLQTLRSEHDSLLPGVLLEYRENQKLRSTYIEALPAARSKRTRRVHTSYHQTGAVTGRLSSSDPNLQNIPIRTELGRRIRGAFVPREADGLLIVADYSQIELRVMAHFSGDQALIRAFAEDHDIHAFVAAQVNNVPLDEVTREMRGRAKAVNFGIIYGQTAFGLAQGTGMSRSEAQLFIDGYFRRYSRVQTFIRQSIDEARRRGFVETLLGRRREIRDIDSRNRTARAAAERFAVNTIIQGSAADLIKLAMVNLHTRIREEALPLRMLLQVHDELVCEAPRDRADELATIVAEVMGGAMELSVPLKVDVATGANWLDAK